MSRLVTQLVADDPAIVLVGENTILFEKIALLLSQKNILVHKISPENLENYFDLLQSAYKVVWVFDESFVGDKKYLKTISILQKIFTPILIIAPIFQTISNYSTNILETWQNDSKKQLQFIIDCNYHLPSSRFIFGQDFIGNNIDKSILFYIFKSIHRGIIIDPGFDLNFCSVDDFIFQVTELIFAPKNQQSVIIKGKKTNSIQFISLIKKLYDAYYGTNTEVVFDKVEIVDSIPFSTREIVVSVDIKTIATYLVKKFPSPDYKDSEDIIVSQREVIPVPEEFIEEISETVSITYSTSQNEDKNSVALEQPVVTGYEETNQTSDLRENLDLNQEIQRIFKDTRTDKKIERVQNIVKTTKKIKKKSKRKTGLFYGGLVSVGMAMGMIILAIIYFISGNVLKEQLISFLESSEGENIFTVQEESSTNSLKILQKNANFVASQTAVYGQIIELNSISVNSVLVNLTNQLVELPTILVEADEASKNLVLQVLAGNIGETKELSQTMTLKAQNAYEKLSLMQVILGQVDLNSNSEKQQQLLEKIEEKIKEIRLGLEIQQQLEPILSDVVGSEEKKTYVLLLQNNQELRPTGGFIQAVALVNFDKGSLVSYKVYSIYEIDKKLPGKVVPPEEISKYLGEESWYMRDSNWDPHFPKSSEQIAWFIEKSLGISVDGVIGINIYGLSKIIEATGPIELPEYNEVITSKNLEERMEFHSEVVLVDSPESVDYAVKILREVLASLITLDKDAIPTLLSSLQDSFEEKQIQVTSFDESSQSIFNSLGWTGGLVVPFCPARLSSVTCSVDVVAQVEANIGINKANYYLKRSILHNINVSKTEAQHKRTITFENTAKSNSWPKGTYKSYQRFFIDSKSTLDRILINGSPLVNEQITMITEGSFTSIGVRVDVPIQKQVVVELFYSTPLSYSEDGFSYVFYNRKQSGLEDDPFTVVIAHSSDIRPTLIAPSAIISNNTITFESDSLDDAALFGIKFE